MSVRTLLLALLCLVLVGLGLSRLQMSADIFGLLPRALPEIEALQVYQQQFGSAREIMVYLEAEDSDTAAAAAEAVAGALNGAGLADRLVWRNPLRNDPVARAELLAWMWFNQPPERFSAFAGRFAPAALEGRLALALERIATALDPQTIGRTLMDPLGFTELGAEQGGGLGALAESDPFSADEGRFRVLFLRPPAEAAAGFLRLHRWVGTVRATIAEVRTAQGLDFKAGIGGTPAMDAEFGAGLVADMQLAAVTTLLLVALLFWLVHRRWRPLLWLSTLLVFVLCATISLGGALFGTLNVISLGFAAILLGLAAGYGLLLYQEFADAPARSLNAHRRAIGPSIAWASATTAGAFLMVGRSSLPGMIQLGVLVALGIVIAAAVMVAVYLSPLRHSRPPAGPGPGMPWAARLANRPRQVWLTSAVLLVASVAALYLTPPGVDAGTRPLGPRHSDARAAMERIEAEIGGERRHYWVISQGRDFDAVGNTLTSVHAALEQARSDGLLRTVALPLALWPSPSRQQDNRATAARLATQRPAVLDAMRAAGFDGESLQLTDLALAAYARLATAAAPAIPETDGTRWLFDRFVSAEPGRKVLALGRVELAADTDPAALQPLARALRDRDGTHVASWQLASRSLLGTMKTDVRAVLLPMLVVLIVLLSVAFRRLGDVLLSLATLGFSFAGLIALMGVVGWQWNLMNVMALPLLLGVAVDYSIHVQLALRRHQGNLVQMQRTVGHAIMLAGATTAIGFGSLGLATNAGLSSLGLVCASGVALACATSTLLLPMWWSTVNRTRLVVQ